MPPVIRPRAAVRWTIIATVFFILPIVAAAAVAVAGTLHRLAFTRTQLQASATIGRLWSQFAALDGGHSHVPATEQELGTILARITATASDGHLVNDIDIEQDDLSDAMAIRLPEAVQVLRTMRTVLPGPREPLTLPVRLRLAELQGQAATIVRIAYVEDFNDAVGLDPSLPRTLGSDLAMSQRATTRGFAAIEHLARRSGAAQDAPAAIGASLDAAIEALVRLEQRVAPTERALLGERIAYLERALWIEIVPAFLGVLAAVALGIFIARSLRRENAFNEIRREAERLAQASRFRAVFESAAAGIVIIDRAGVVCETNGAFDAMLGYPRGHFRGTHLSPHTFEADRRKTVDRFSELADGSIDSYQYEKRYLHADGHAVWVDVAVSRLPPGDPEGWFAIGLVENISDRKATEAQLLYDATHDELTGLANRSLLAAHLDDVLRRKRDVTAAVVFIDLDHFKLVNDSLGHAAGDQILRAVAERLREFAGPADTVARFGGDEFAVLFGDLAHVADLTRRVHAIQARVAEPLVVEGRTIYSSASIGVAPLSERYTEAEELLRDADTAMYRAKAEGRARAALFDRAMHEGAVRRLQLTSDLRSAITSDELIVAYQPIVRLRDGEVVAFEALVRWNHPREGLLAPSEFITLAEETGQIVALGRNVFAQACRQLARERATRPHVQMHINLAVEEIMQEDLAEFVSATLIEAELPANSIVLEITENAIIESSLASDVSLRSLRAIGVGICIDDFGVGYSSLRYLHRLPISGLKIDRSFVSGTAGTTGLTSEPIVRMLLELARTLGLDVVAEGIEHDDQRDALEALGAQYGQGYLFAEPAVQQCV